MQILPWTSTINHPRSHQASHSIKIALPLIFPRHFLFQHLNLVVCTWRRLFSHFYDTFILNYDGKHWINLNPDSQRISLNMTPPKPAHTHARPNVYLFFLSLKLCRFVHLALSLSLPLARTRCIAETVFMVCWMVARVNIFLRGEIIFPTRVFFVSLAWCMVVSFFFPRKSTNMR